MNRLARRALMSVFVSCIPLPSRSSFSELSVIVILLLMLFFDPFFSDCEVVVRVDFPEGRRETFCVADVAE